MRQRSKKKFLEAEPAFFNFLRQMVREVQPMLRMPNSSTRDKRNQPTQEKIVLRVMRQSLKKNFSGGTRIFKFFASDG